MIINSFNLTTVPSKADVLVEQGSKFIGYLKAVSTEEEVKAFLLNLKNAHPDATHICYAYMLNPTNRMQKQKYSDDKEPAGTAGAPLLNILKTKNIGNACLAVVRYFGGTLLGTAGLAKAYASAGEKAVKTANLALVNYSTVYEFELEYNEVKKAEQFIKENNGNILESDYQEVVVMTVGFYTIDLKKVTEKLNNALGRKAHIKVVGQRFC